MDIPYHYPPQLMTLLIEAIPAMFRGKKDVLLFFRGAGVEQRVLQDLERRVATDRDGIGKHEIVRTVLARLNEAGDAMIRERREIVKRVTECEDFSTAWDNQQDKAKATVADIRKLINVKDYFTRLADEREKENRQHRQAIAAHLAAVREKKAQLAALRDELSSTFPMADAWKRGKKLESVLNRLFKASDISVRESFTLKGDEGAGIVEQIDGVVEIDGHLYLVEVKWWKEPLGPGEVSQHLVRVFNRGQSRGIFISATGYTDGGVQVCRESLHRAPFVLSELEEIVRALEADLHLAEFFKKKIHAAILDKQPLFRVL